MSSTVGKAYHKIVRSRSVPALRQAATPLQIGGLPKCPVTMAAQVVRLHQSWCKGKGISQAVLFLDLREAFYRIVRPLVTGFSGTDEDIARVVSAVNLPPGVMHDLHAHLERHSLFAQSGATDWVDAAASEALHNTWFRFEHGETVTETSVGTRPGDNLADLVFSFVFARVLRQVRQSGEITDSVTRLSWHQTMLSNVLPCSQTPVDTLQLLDCTWMDDSAFVLCHPDAGTLVANLQHISGALLDSCLGRALLPNLDRGKTEAILALQGRHSRKLRADLFRQDPPTLDAPSQLWPGAKIRLVTQYKHLGGMLHHTCSLLREVKCRVALAWGAFNKRRKRVFASPVVARRDKMILFESLVLSVLLYGAGGWPSVGPAEISPLATTYHHMVATMLRPQFSLEEAKHLGPAQVLSLAELPSVPVLLHLARLRHLQSCVVVGVPEFWALAHVEGSWLSLVRASLGWLFDMTNSDPGISSWEDVWPHWKDTMETRPGAWKRLLRKAQQRAIRGERWSAARLHHRGLLSRQLQLAGGILICDPPPEWDRSQCCAPCGKVFDNKQKWSVHAFKCHGRTTIGRGVLKGHQCQFCLRHFGTNLKLCKHLAYSATCRHGLCAAGFNCPIEPGQGSRKAEDVSGTQAPVLQASGPELEPHNLPWFDAEDRPVAEILDCLSHIGVSQVCGGSDDYWAHIKTAFSCVCAETGRLRITAEVFLTRLEDSDHLSPSQRDLLRSAMEWISRADIVAWLVPSPDIEEYTYRTFQDGDLVLHMLEVVHLTFPSPKVCDSSCVRCLVGPTDWCLLMEKSLPNSISFTIDECTDTIGTGGSPTFFDGPYEDVAFHICLGSWTGFCSPPPHDTSSLSFQPCLIREVFCGDVVRLALRLWGLGVPASLYFHPDAVPTVAPLPEISFLEKCTEGDNCVLRNAWTCW